MTVKFWISSFDYLKKAGYPIAPSHRPWVNDQDSDTIAVFWSLSSQDRIMPFAVHRDTDPENQESTIYHLRAEVETRSIEEDVIGKLRIKEKKHLLKKNEEILEADLGFGYKAVKGEMFTPKGNLTYYPSKGDPGVLLLSDPFTKGEIQTQWEVKNDKSIRISENGGTKWVGKMVADEEVRGFEVQGPIHLWDDPASKYQSRDRDRFCVHALVAPMIMPSHRPANMTKLLWWLKKLGAVGLDEGSGAL